MSGNSALVPETAQKALNMNMSGLMIEVHHDPQHALSDSNQQLSPGEFEDMINNLVFSKATSDDIQFRNILEELRNQIDSIDHQLIELVASRMKISERIGEYKCRNGVTVFQLERWLDILRTRMEHGINEGLDREFVGNLIRMIHEESMRCQDRVIDRLRSSGICPPPAENAGND
jgi:chorismate mutase